MNFNKIMPNWANKGNEPSEDLKANGFKAGNKPPANIFNWFFGLITDGIKEIQEKLSGEETARINADKEFELRTTAYPVVTFEKNTASGYGVLHVTIPDISSYEDLIDKPIYIDTEDKYLDTDLTMYIQINGYSNMQIRKCVPRQAMNSVQYKAYEITTNMIMQLAFYKHWSGKYYCYWVNSIAGEVATNEIYGRVKLSDNTGDTSDASTSIAATPYLVSLKADKQTNNGGFEGGENANATDGGAVGYSANATSGGAVGGGAKETEGGGAVGYMAIATKGGAVGRSANATSGGAVGNGANAKSGGAVGEGAISESGFAGGIRASAIDGCAIGPNAYSNNYAIAVGSNAKAYDDCVQLGTGTNSTNKTLQVYDYTLMNADGSIPAERLPNAANIKKNPDATDGDIIDTHLTVGFRGGDIGLYSIVSGGHTNIGAAMKYNKASGENSAAIAGTSNTASGDGSAALGGHGNTASGDGSTVLGGGSNTVSATYSTVLGGYDNTVSGAYSTVLGGNRNTALNYQVKAGHYSKDGTAGTESGTTGDAFTIGNGSSGTARSNCFRVDYAGNVYGLAAFKASGADIAELYEWADGNPNNEDRRGLFVTLDGSKIRIATPEDTYIKGIISAMPCLVGDSQSEVWQGMYLKDVFGEYLKDENGSYILNPDYNPDEEYIPREERPEFDFVSNWGKIVLVDDGTCEVNGFCKVGTGGKATKAEGQTLYRVMERKDDTHIFVSVG